MVRFFGYISDGYAINQAADLCLYPRKWVWNTLYSDDDTLAHVLDLSMQAGALIRMGVIPVPDRYDRLYHDDNSTLQDR